MLETNEASVDKEVATFLERSMPDGTFVLRCLRLFKFKWQHPAIAKGSLRSRHHSDAYLLFHMSVWRFNLRRAWLA
jgi:hypothetical protein